MRTNIHKTNYIQTRHPSFRDVQFYAPVMTQGHNSLLTSGLLQIFFFVIKQGHFLRTKHNGGTAMTRHAQPRLCNQN
jgi:hypothetical protein